jgi:hypothetical protein
MPTVVLRVFIGRAMTENDSLSGRILWTGDADNIVNIEALSNAKKLSFLVTHLLPELSE